MTITQPSVAQFEAAKHGRAVVVVMEVVEFVRLRVPEAPATTPTVMTR